VADAARSLRVPPLVLTTETLALRIWNETFRFYDVGLGAAHGVVAFGLCLLLMGFALRRLLRSFWG
jgi:ABC-type sugar transport system permease subunit